MLIIVLVLMLSSCASGFVKVDSPEKEITLEIIKMAKSDTTEYKIVELDKNIYAVNDDKVVLINEDSVTLNKFTTIILLLIFVIIILIWGMH